jgi:hypothetical protein
MTADAPDKEQKKHLDPFVSLEANIWGEPKREKALLPWVMVKPPTGTLYANKDNQVSLAAGEECVGVKIQNNSATTIMREIDSPAGVGSWNIDPGGSEYLDVYCSVVHIWVTVDTPVNNTQIAASVVVEAGQQP